MAGSVIEPQYLAIHVTYQCPAKCDHCCFSSDMTKRGHLTAEQICHAIDGAASASSIRLVGFTGGDPFLHHAILKESIAYANKSGLRTRVVTSAYWAKTAVKAMQVLEPLAAVGLDEITVSFDDSHAAFVSEACIVNAFSATKSLDVTLAVNVCREPNSVIDRNYIQRMLGIEQESDLIRIEETWINTTGRARDAADKETIDSRKGHPEARLSPCQHVLRGPTVTPTGKILPCCGTIPFRKRLQIGTLATDGVRSALDNAYDDWLLKWIAFEGPAEIVCQVTNGTPYARKLSSFDGNCNACDELLSDPIILKLVEDYLPTKLPSLKLQEAIYSAAGIYRPPSTLKE